MTIQHDGAVYQTITVAASQARAFEVFTAEFDAWWPRTHHIGSSPMTKGIIEGRVGGRCYSEQQDGTECPWGQVLVWDPPRRLVLAWQVTPDWGFDADLSHASEVEITFVDLGHGDTRVDLYHRHFERTGEAGTRMRGMVDAPGGWGSLLDLFAARALQGGAQEANL